MQSEESEVEMEKRTSPRTKTNVILSARQGKVSYTLKCTELSQTGLLLCVPRALKQTPWPYLRATLLLNDGPVHLLARRVGERGNRLAYSFLVLDDASEARLTDFLFDCLYEQQVGSRRQPRRRAA
ncbi:MAG: PilZ domain-containing protein [Polyangiaceae bacterium]|nr:PilZ domain-containing protein [Polyangiaceae bacterium]MBK9001006.1 PilZ domain-containing protein [Myxococcales bacterium]